MVKKIWLLFMLEGQKEGIPEQPAQSITGMVLVPWGMEISILSLGRHGVGRAGLTGKSLSLFRVRASGNMSGSLVGAHGARQGGQCWARVFSSCSFPAGRSTSGWDMPGSCPTERGMDPWCRVWALAAFIKVFKDKSAVTSLCPWELSSSGPEQSLCCPVIPAGRRQRRQAPGLVPYSHRARRHWEPILSTMRSFFRRAGGAGSDVRRGRAPAAAQGSRQRAQLHSAPLQLCRGLGTGEPNRCLHLHR